MCRHVESTPAPPCLGYVYLGELPELQDISVAEAVDDPLSLPSHVLVLLAQRAQFGEFTD